MIFFVRTHPLVWPMTHAFTAKQSIAEQSNIESNSTPQNQAAAKMNRTARTDEPYEGELTGYNQSPNPLSPALTTNRDLNGIVNIREQRDNGQGAGLGDDSQNRENNAEPAPDEARDRTGGKGLAGGFISISQPMGRWLGRLSSNHFPIGSSPASASASPTDPPGQGSGTNSWKQTIKKGLLKFFSFVGPGFMVAVAYSMTSHQISVHSRMNEYPQKSNEADEHTLQLILETILPA